MTKPLFKTFVYQLKQNLDAKDDAKFCIIKRVNSLTFIDRKTNYTLPQRHSRSSKDECRLISNVQWLTLNYLPWTEAGPKTRKSSVISEKRDSHFLMKKSSALGLSTGHVFLSFLLTNIALEFTLWTLVKLKSLIASDQYLRNFTQHQKTWQSLPDKRGVSTGHDFLAFLTNIAMEFILWVLAKSKGLIAQSGFTELHIWIIQKSDSHFLMTFESLQHLESWPGLISVVRFVLTLQN